ncbi:IS200/IS605 family transposase [Flavobacterium phragmitis]|uniref:REP element-mobilizing transposase RayT n=1 Tax=Flavobacterium phragmitis TaxID=739143 RepID=A0A1I1JTB5_9FLAO|nr:IS200/IS605 family transposase [Flavobacterium phragmitis]SFC51899.1 REP element-mobilizing transposase RayT [Flavobacterium phragmitis]
MSQSFTKLWIHVIWATKNRQELIDFSIEKDLYDFIWQELTELGCPVRIINGMPDHVHVLFLQNPQKSITDIVKQIKGSSSHFMNRGEFILEKFAWQTGFATFSVSESQLDIVYNYIKNQKEHHLTKNTQDEFDGFIKRHGLEGK